MKIKELRERKKMTQEELSREIGVKRTTVSMWELGHSMPTADKLRIIANVLCCSVDELLQ